MAPRPRSSNRDGRQSEKSPARPESPPLSSQQPPRSDRLSSPERDLLERHVEPLVEPSGLARTLALLEQYFVLLRQWNRRSSLISRGDESRVIERHALDSLAMIPALDEIRPGSILDLGSGGGLPGIPIKILRPELDVTLLDSRRMKTLFLLRAVNELGLSGVRVWRGRVEDLAQLPIGEGADQRIAPGASIAELEGPGRRPRFDAVIARAVAPLSELAVWAAPLVVPEGHLLAPKGSRMEAEVAEWEDRPGPWRLAKIHRGLRPQLHLIILQRS